MKRYGYLGIRKMKKRHHTQSSAFAPNAATNLMRKLQTGSRVALTPRESMLNTMNSALADCRNLVGVVAATSGLLRREEIVQAGNQDQELIRTAKALSADLKAYNGQLQTIETKALDVRSITEELDFLPAALEVCQALTEWQENFSKVVLPLNGQVHDICIKLTEEPASE